jgi:hypothetical protein
MKNISNKLTHKLRNDLGYLRGSGNKGVLSFSYVGEQFKLLAFRFLRVKRRRLHSLGLLGGGLAAGTGFGAGSLGTGTLGGSGSSFFGSLLLLFIIVLRILLHQVMAQGFLENNFEILLRQRIELER